MHMAEIEDPKHADQRLAAMMNRTPVHTLLFSQNGRIIAANKAAADKIQAVGGNEHTF